MNQDTSVGESRRNFVHAKRLSVLKGSLPDWAILTNGGVAFGDGGVTFELYFLTATPQNYVRLCFTFLTVYMVV